LTERTRQRLPSILPALSYEAALEVTAWHAIAGVLPAASPLVRRPPGQAPHRTSTTAALVGGGTGLARPARSRSPNPEFR
jgi:magnesium chelatase family protein